MRAPGRGLPQRLLSALLRDRQLAVARRDTVVDVLRRVKEMGADLDAPQGERGVTPLGAAIELGRADLAEALLAAGASADAADAQGAAPPGWRWPAASHGCWRCWRGTRRASTARPRRRGSPSTRRWHARRRRTSRRCCRRPASCLNSLPARAGCRQGDGQVGRPYPRPLLSARRA
ncbi:hypothetical protein WJ973_15890 [Achromobacter xylosoxidans]